MRRGTVIAYLAAAGLACGASPAMAAPFATPEDWSGSWHGTYVCAQGVTGLTLAITPSGPDSVTAVFSFYAVPGNPAVPSGEFTMSGRLGSRTGRLALTPQEWKVRPPLYLSVGLDGVHDQRSGEYRGRVYGPGCAGFRLRRDLVG